MLAPGRLKSRFVPQMLNYIEKEDNLPLLLGKSQQFIEKNKTRMPSIKENNATVSSISIKELEEEEDSIILERSSDKKTVLWRLEGKKRNSSYFFKKESPGARKIREDRQNIRRKTKTITRIKTYLNRSVGHEKIIVNNKKKITQENYNMDIFLKRIEKLKKEEKIRKNNYKLK